MYRIIEAYDREGDHILDWFDVCDDLPGEPDTLGCWLRDASPMPPPPPPPALCEATELPPKEMITRHPDTGDEYPEPYFLYHYVLDEVPPIFGMGAKAHEKVREACVNGSWGWPD